MNSRRPVVLDTDTFNEVDDQFALAHLLLSPEQCDLQAVYAAPFFNKRSSGPEQGMELSYQEIFKVLSFFTLEEPPPVYRGSKQFMRGPDTPVESEAATDLIEKARAAAAKGGILHVLTIGACTNVASAILLAPDIAKHIRVVWLGGHAPYWPHTNEFNLQGDLHASRVLMEARAPLVLVPCLPMASHLLISVAELDASLAPYSELGQYLTDIVRDYEGDPLGWSKEIWDIAVSAWAVNPSWFTMQRQPAPRITDDLKWQPDDSRPEIEVALRLDRDAIFADFYTKCKEAREAGVLA